MGLSQGDSLVCWETFSNDARNPSFPTALPRPTAPQASGTPRLQQPNSHVFSSEGGPAVVAPQCLHVEREEPAGDTSTVGNRHRCLLNRLGSLLPGSSHWRRIVSRGGGYVHKPTAAAGSTVCFERISERAESDEFPAEDRQYIHGGIYQPHCGTRSQTLVRIAREL